MESVVNAIAPKLKGLLPFLAKKMRESDDLIKQDEIIVIARKKNKDFIIVKSKRENTVYNLKNDDEKEVFNLEILIEKLLNLQAQNK